MDKLCTKSHMKTRFKCTQKISKYGLIHSDVSMESEKIIIITNLVDVIKNAISDGCSTVVLYRTDWMSWISPGSLKHKITSFEALKIHYFETMTTDYLRICHNSRVSNFKYLRTKSLGPLGTQRFL